MADEQTPEQLQQELFNQALPQAAPEAEAPPEAPQAVETPEVPPQAPQAPPVQPPPEPGVPSWRLREEAEARRNAEVRAQQLEARLNELATHIRQTQKQPDFFENPDQAARNLVAQALQPFAEQNNRIIEQQQRTIMFLGKNLAEAVHGTDVVAEAERAFLEARDAQTLDPADYERVVQAPNRYDEVVRWRQRQSMLETVGTDPNAWFESQLEARMADPQFQAKMLEKVRAGAAGRPSTTKLPPSLSKATASAPNREVTEGDMSDASLFAYAMNSKGRRQ